MTAPHLLLSIADGFSDDCDELIHQCLKETPVTYSGFCNVFRNMQMSCVFLGRQSGAEIAELSEELIHIAKYYMVANTSSFEASVVGLFLVYALVKLQPFKDFAYLRLCEEDVPYVERIELVAKRDRRLDVLYILGKVLTENTRYTAANRERGMELSYRKYLENCSTYENIGQRPKGVFLRQNEELDIMKELNDLQLRYDAAKKEVNVPELKYVDSKFATDLSTSLKNIVSGIIEDNGTKADSETEKEDSDAVKARAVKEKAMKNKVDPMRHLIAVADRSKKKTTEPHVSDIKSKPGKIKTGSPTKQAFGNMNKQTLVQTNKAKKRRRSTDSDISEESDNSMELSDHESDNDIDLDNFNMAPPSPEANEINETEVEVINENIRLEDLPCLITSDDNGQSYEIEIIDRYKKSTNESDVPPTTKPKPKVKKNNQILLRKKKRELKKTILKSRFKRMGMDPIVEFKNT